jgi:AcrR family transcriptional regulator
MSRPASELSPKRAEIADAALRIIETRGITALTTSALAAELGVSSGAPFRHFASREEILEAVVQRVEELILATFPPETAPPLDRIQGLLRARAQVVGGHRGIGRLMFSDQFVLALPASAAARLRAVVARTRDFLLAALVEAQRDATIRADLTPKALASVTFGLLMQLVHAQAAGQGQASDADEACATLRTLLQPPAAP